MFKKLEEEEIEAGWEEEHDEDIPNFGDSLSGYEDVWMIKRIEVDRDYLMIFDLLQVVGPFYAFWESFCTVKSFAWNDEYDTRRAECRRVSLY